MGWIYIITNMKNGKCYVGQTIRKKPQARWSCEKSNPHGILKHAFSKYGIEQFKFETIHEVPDSETMRDDLDSLEIMEIGQRNTLQPNGYNIERGGKRYKGDGNKGKPRSEETKLRISSSLVGKKHSEDRRRQNSESHKGEKHSRFGKFGKDSPTSKKVFQLTLNGEHLRMFDSISIASKETSISIQNISKCCRGKSKTSCGFIWKFAEYMN